MENQLDDSLFGSQDPKPVVQPILNEQAKAIINKDTQEVIRQISRVIEQGGSVAMVPKGSKAIIVRQEFNPELKNKITELENELLSIKKISSQEDAAKANAILKRAKQLDKTMLEERKLMSSVLDEEKTNLINYQETTVSPVSKLIPVINTWITDFQKEELLKQQERDEELKRQRDEELAKAKAEADRKTGIQTKILEFENSVIRACASATVGDIDDKIKKLAAISLKKETYEEFLPEAEIMYQNCVTRMNARKTELMELARLAEKDKAEAEKMKKEQEEKHQQEMKNQQEKAKETIAEIESQKQNDIVNSQMGYELKSSAGEKIKGIQQRWTFDAENIDMTLLPEEFKTFDKEKIKEAIKNGCREIAGVRIFKDVVNVSK